MRVSFIGDSLTDSAMNGSISTWTDTAAAHSGSTVIGTYGLSGEDTRVILDRALPLALADRSQAIVMMTGMNDLEHGASEAEFRSRIREFVVKVRGQGKVPMLVVPPLYGPGASEESARAWISYRRVLLEVAQSAPFRCYYSAAGDVLTPASWTRESPSLFRYPEHASDISHLTPRGAYLMGRAVAADLARVVGRPRPAEPGHVLPITDQWQATDTHFAIRTVPAESPLFDGTATELDYGPGARGSVFMGPVGDAVAVPAGSTVEVSCSYRVVESPDKLTPAYSYGLTMTVEMPGQTLYLRPGVHYTGDAGVMRAEVKVPKATDLDVTLICNEQIPAGERLRVHLGGFAVRRVR